MKGIATVSLLGLSSILVLGITLDVNSTTIRKNEQEDSLSISMRNTLKASNVNQMYDVDEAEMSAELIRNLAENINTDSTLDIYVYEASTKGLLDVQLEGSFSHLNGDDDTKSIRKTLFLESTPID